MASREVTISGLDDPQSMADELQEALQDHIDSGSEIFRMEFYN